MARISVITQSGAEREIEAATGISLMEALRGGGIDEVLAVCGGCCSCATCHVHIDAAYLDALPPMGDDEYDLLDSLEARDFRSRLSCQIQVTDVLDGMTVTVGAAD